MIRSDKLRIFELCHKEVPYGFWDNEIFVPLQVGASCNENDITFFKDNTGDSISEWNPVYAEITGLWWAYKNLPKKVQAAGICQYRRRFPINVDVNPDDIFKDCDVVVSDRVYFVKNPQMQYAICHNIEDLNFCEEVVKDLYPDYAEAWDECIKNRNYMYYSNSFIMKREDFDRYCEWLFSILDEYKKRKGWNCPDDVISMVEKEIAEKKRSDERGVKYQSQIFGFLSERLLNVFVYHNFKRILELPYVKFEEGI